MWRQWVIPTLGNSPFRQLVLHWDYALFFGLIWHVMLAQAVYLGGFIGVLWMVLQCIRLDRDDPGITAVYCSVTLIPLLTFLFYQEWWMWKRRRTAGIVPHKNDREARRFRLVSSVMVASVVLTLVTWPMGESSRYHSSLITLWICGWVVAMFGWIFVYSFVAEDFPFEGWSTELEP